MYSDENYLVQISCKMRRKRKLPDKAMLRCIYRLSLHGRDCSLYRLEVFVAYDMVNLAIVLCTQIVLSLSSNHTLNKSLSLNNLIRKLPSDLAMRMS